MKERNLAVIKDKILRGAQKRKKQAQDLVGKEAELASMNLRELEEIVLEKKIEFAYQMASDIARALAKPK